MTARSGRYYGYNNNPFGSDSATYTNNRRTGWSYNEDGQVTSTPSTSTDLPRTMTYDAAGRMTTTFESGSNVTYAAGYDGDGQLVHEIVTKPGSSEGSYVVRSSVLGEVLTRLNGSGGKRVKLKSCVWG